MEITIKIPAIDNLADAIRALKGASSITLTPEGQPSGLVAPPTASPAPSAPVTYDETVYNPPAAPVAPTAPPAPVAAPVAPVAPVAPPAPVAAPEPAVAPTAPMTFTRQQLAIAATGLVDAGRKNDLVGLLSHFGIKSLTELPEQNFGLFATALRQLGAAI